MAPRDQPKTTKVQQRTIVKQKRTATTTTSTSSTAIQAKNSTVKSTVKNATVASRQRTNTSTVPKPQTPKPEKKPVPPVPGSVTKSGKKLWKRRPKPAHSGVPVPEKMKKLINMADFSF